MRPRPLLLLAALALGVSRDPALAAPVSLSERATEDTAVGYSLLAVRGWEALPRKNPGDPTSGNQVGGWYAKDAGRDGPRCVVLAFGTFFPEQSVPVATITETGGDPGGEDGGAPPAEPKAPPGPADPKEPKRPTSAADLFGVPPASFEEWVGRLRKALRGRLTVELNGTPRKFGDDEGIYYEGMIRQPGAPGHRNLLAASVRRGSFEVAVLYEADDDKNYVRDFRGSFRSSVQSLRILSQRAMERARQALAKKVAAAGGDDAGWAERVIAGLPKGWISLRTEHYAIVYDSSIDAEPPVGIPGLTKRIGRQLELLRRDIYEPLFPTEKPVTAISVVKVTQDPDQYLAYGAPQGSAGYWSWPSRELVFFCKSGKQQSEAQRGMDLTLDVLNHEAFHQYIYYAVGQVSPHSWFNEGHGDYFAGWELIEGKFRPGKFAWRTGVIRKAIEAGTYVPLREFLSYTQQQYYRRGGDPRKGENVSQNYAQGWSLIWFLRTTKDPKYQGILDRYFNKLKEGMKKWRAEDAAAAAKEKRPPLPAFLFPPDLNQKAMDEALAAFLEGIDVEQLEKDWIASKPY